MLLFLVGGDGHVDVNVLSKFIYQMPDQDELYVYVR